jgi:TPR repeat protein
MRVTRIVAALLAFATPVVFAQQIVSNSEFATLKARAESGDAKAQIAVARAYEDGSGVPQNAVEAWRWYMKAAEAGDPEAEDAIAFAYRTGRGVEKNFTESLNWYSLAAKQGDANAMFNIGTHYYNGDGVTIDDVAAYAWFWLAKKAGSKRADDAVTRLEKDLSPQQLNDVKLLVADMLAEGKAVPRDTVTALTVYEEAGRYGKPEVQLRLAKVFLNGWGVPKDAGKAETYCRKALALEKNYTPAMLCLGYLDQSGRLGPAGAKDAITWYEKAFKLGDPVAAYGLGVAYATANGTQQNLERAFSYLVIASLSNIEVATPLAKQIEQKLSPEAAKKLVKKANEEKRARGIYAFGTLDKQFAYVVKVERLP